MTGAEALDGKRYRAFISYSHKDAAFANRLHRRLESYVLPKSLGVSRRLSPIFKDREELSAAHDLSAQVRAALESSSCLIVICSPDAATSPWVGREIELFKQLHPDRPILAALWRGEPGEAFPPALSMGGTEPLAADFRKVADGERLAFLKLVAGLANIGVDRLVQRDTQRRLRTVTALTAASLVGMLAMGGATLFALESRAEAERERARAERLAEFMMTDLRYKLNAVGSLDIMEGVNRRIWEEYGAEQSKRSRKLPPGLQAVFLLALGEDETKRGKVRAARTHFLEALEITSIQLSENPSDPKRIFAQAQSQYWVGYASYLEGDATYARRSWEGYKALSEQLALSSPQNRSYRRELGFADGNLCTLAISLENAADRAITSCQQALDRMTALLAEQPDDLDQQANVANRHGWMADALKLAGRLDAARQHRTAEQALLNVLRIRDSRNMTYRMRWVANQRALGTLEAKSGQFDEALARLTHARQILDDMIAFEPNNIDLSDQRRKFDVTISNIRRDRSNIK